MRFLVLAHLLFICCQISHSRVLEQRARGKSTIAAFMDDENTIQLEADGNDKVVDYRTTQRVLGISAYQSAVIAMVSNYGFWGCVISDETQDKMLARTRLAQLDEQGYQEHFKQGGCYSKMEAQVEKWLRVSAAGGPPLHIPAAPIFSNWRQRSGGRPEEGLVPSKYPFVYQAAKDIRNKLSNYIRDDETLHIPFLGRVGTRRGDAVVIRQKAIESPIEQLNPMVEIFATGHNFVAGGAGKFLPVGKFDIFGTWQHIFQEDECDGEMKWMWSKEEVKDLGPYNVIAFGSMRDISDYSILMEAENAVRPG